MRTLCLRGLPSVSLPGHHTLCHLGPCPPTATCPWASHFHIRTPDWGFWEEVVGRPSLRSGITVRVRGSAPLRLHRAVLPTGRTGLGTFAERPSVGSCGRRLRPLGGRGSHPNTLAGLAPGACWALSIFGNPWRLRLIHRHLASEMENFTCQVAMETGRATEKIYAEWSAPSLHQMPCVSRIPSQAVQAALQAWRLAPGRASRLRHWMHWRLCHGMHCPALSPFRAQPTTPPTGLASPQAGVGT